MLKHYIEYVYPSFLNSETFIMEIPERDTNVEIPDYCFGFRFFDKTVTVVDGETLTSDKKNVSGWYFQGEKMTLDQVKEAYGNNSSYDYVIAKMEKNGYNVVVKNKFGFFVPMHENDTII